MIKLISVVACTPSFGIGKDGILPWGAAGINLPTDMKYFKKITSSTVNPNKINAALMGRRTWLGIPEKYRPLANRLNIVLSNDPAFIATLPKEILIAKSLEDAINLINLDANLSNLVENIMIIGGMQLFEESMFHPLCDAYHLTRINSDFPCDTYLSDRTIQKIKTMQPFSVSEEFHENGLSYRMEIYKPSSYPN